MKRHVVEIFRVERCRSLTTAIERVRRAVTLEASGEAIDIRVVLIETFEEAVARRFFGSPTVHVDGVDVEDGARVAPVCLGGRGYVVDGRLERAPTEEMIGRALRSAMSCGGEP
jgi:hypothetical protein